MTAYVPYTKRLPLVEEFTPEESEDRLYDLVSEYLRRDNLQALPASQRSLMTLVLRKLLASSTFAIAGALTSMANRLKAKLAQADRERTRWKTNSTRTTRPSTRPPRNGLTTTPPSRCRRQRTAQALEREIADLEEFARPGHVHRRTTPRARRC